MKAEVGGASDPVLRRGRPRSIAASFVRSGAESGALVLLAGWPVRSAAVEAGAAVPAGYCTACGAVDRRRPPTDEQLQRPIVRTLLLALGQLVRVDRAKHRAAVGIHHGHYHLRSTRRVEHDPIQSGPAAADLHELTYRGHLHGPSLLRAGIPGTASTTPTVGGARLSDGPVRWGSLEVVNDLAGAGPLLWRDHEVDVPATEAVERMIGHAACVDTHGSQLVTPCHRRLSVRKRADRLPALHAGGRRPEPPLPWRRDPSGTAGPASLKRTRRPVLVHSL
jgi:hypothetical protein